MTWILGGAAVLCLVYYGIIAVYTGTAASFALFWPALAAVLGLMALGFRFYSRHGSRIPLWVPVSLGTAFAAGLVIFTITEAVIGWGALTSRGQAADYLIVLGARVRGTELSNSLVTRLNRAVVYAEDHPNTTLVLSGGRGEGEDISEARAMFDYLKYNGVPEERLLIEDQSTSTAENITYSLKVIERCEYNMEQAARAQLKENYRARSEGDTIRIAIVTNDYHIFRAKAIAKKQGVVSPVGVTAHGDPILALHMWVREGFAVLKDKFMGRL